MTFFKLVIRNILRRPLRTSLTAITLAAAITVFASLLALDHGLHRMIEKTAEDNVVIAFERYKACPPYSRLPVHYADLIAQVPHVTDVMPVRFLLSNCQTTTNLVALHGVDADKLLRFRRLDLPDDAYAAFVDEQSSALVGRAVANRYGWRIGDTVTLPEMRGISFVLRGIYDAPGSSLDSVILVHREFLERSIDQVGIATMFMVLVDRPDQMNAVSRQIDALFAGYPAQTNSGPEKDFIASNIEDFRHMVDFAQVIAWLALILLMGAVANSMSMSVRERMGEMALMRTRGFTSKQVIRLILLEAVAISVAATSLGLLTTWLILGSERLAISVEGFTIMPHLSANLILLSLAAGALLGCLAALWPAAHGARIPIILGLSEVD